MRKELKSQNLRMCMSLNNDVILLLSIFSNEKIIKLFDHIKLEIKDAQKWIDDIIYQTKHESKIKKDRCEICNSKEDPEYLELHHPSGRKHDYRMTTVCKPCHRWLTERQDTWDVRWKEKNQSKHLRQAFFLLGLQDMLILKSMKTGNRIYEKLAYSYNEKINVLLNWWQN